MELRQSGATLIQVLVLSEDIESVISKACYRLTLLLPPRYSFLHHLFRQGILKR